MPMADKFRVVDLETTGIEDGSEPVECGVTDYFPEEDTVVVVGSSFVKPTKPIPFTATAIHHITDEEVATAPVWAKVSATYLSNPAEAGEIIAFVAHNAEFEARWLTEEILCSVPLICTFKAALRVWPDSESHSNQALRYGLKLPLEHHRAMPPHRALPDTYVTAFILRELMKHATVDEMIAWSKEPPLQKRVSFGQKHKGQMWSDVPTDYLLWIVDKSDLDENTKWMARRMLRRRAYVTTAIQVARIAKNADDLLQWFKDETDHRAEHDIKKGDSDYQSIIDACAARKADILGGKVAA